MPFSGCRWTPENSFSLFKLESMPADLECLHAECPKSFSAVPLSNDGSLSAWIPSLQDLRSSCGLGCICSALLGCPLVFAGKIVLTSAGYALCFDGAGCKPSFFLVLWFKVSILFLTASACFLVSEPVIFSKSTSLWSISLLSVDANENQS